MSRTEVTTEKGPTTWEQYLSAFDENRRTTKRVLFRPPRAGMEPLTFVIRELTQEQSDEVDSAPLKVRQQRGGAEVDFDLGSQKDLLIKHGVVSGPPGWKGTDRDVRGLSAEVRDDLAAKIRAFSTLDEETKIGFR